MRMTLCNIGSLHRQVLGARI